MSSQINPKYLRLLKSGKKNSKKEIQEEEKGLHFTPEGDSFAAIISSNPNLQSWLKEDRDPDYNLAVTFFNMVNQDQNSSLPEAQRISIVTLRGTTFEDKRLTAIQFANEVETGEHSGRILLIPEPENPYDPNALKACPEGYPPEKFIGYIPRENNLNVLTLDALQENRFCGAHLADAPPTKFKGKPNRIMTIAIGWKAK